MAFTLMPWRRPLAGEQPREAGKAALARRVGRDADAALEGQERGDVDDLAAASSASTARPPPETGRTWT